MKHIWLPPVLSILIIPSTISPPRMRVMRNLVLHLQGHTQSAVEELSVLSGHGASSSAQLPFTVLKVHLGKRPTPLENWTADTTQER